MSKYARIDNGTVTEFIDTENDITTMFHPDMVWVDCPSGINLGDIFVDGVFLPPPDTDESAITVPEQITPRQGYIILSRYSLLAPVKSYFDALEGQPGEEARIELEYAQEWKRDWPTLNAAATAFGLTSEQIDQMFVEASAL